MGCDGDWYQGKVVSFHELHDFVSTVSDAILFVGFAVAAELLLLSFPQTRVTLLIEQSVSWRKK